MDPCEDAIKEDWPSIPDDDRLWYYICSKNLVYGRYARFYRDGVNPPARIGVKHLEDLVTVLIEYYTRGL